MNQKIKKFFPFIISFLISTSLGVLFHFLFTLLNNSIIISWLVPINESIFEHLKLLFYPFLLVSIIELHIRKKSIKNYFPYRISAITIAIIILPVLYYGIKACIGNVGFINISLYFLCMALAYYLSYKAEKKQLVPTLSMRFIAISMTILLVFLFTIMTYFPPELELFRDPINNSYGLKI